MLRYASGEEPKIGDQVADGMGTSWEGVVISIIGPNNDRPFTINDGDSTTSISEALIIKFDNLADEVIEENPEDELVLLARAKHE
ncbi:MAG: hypothetical protein GY951_13155 [Psychromonas sp.]|nr:hypothetical protein [Psychromonas sp.]